MQTARVSSIEALRLFRAAMQQFMSHADKALCEADMELQRVCDWVRRDQPAHWKNEIRKRQEALERAREELRRAQFTTGEHKPAAVEQKKAVKLAEARLEEAREKFEITRRWQTQMEQVANEYKGQIQQMASAIEADLPRAVATIDKALRALESYTTETAPASDAGDLAESISGPSSSAMTPEERADADAPLSLKACRALRRLSPDANGRSAVEVQPLPIDEQQSAAEPRPLIVFRDRISVERLKPPRDSIVIYDPRVLQEDQIFLERAHTGDDRDSGWFIGVPQWRRAVSEDRAAATVGEFLRARPELRELLSLPHGHLVVLEDSEIIRMIDPHDADIWNVEERSSSEEEHE